MQQEELKIPEALKAAGKWIRHVHIAENTRCEPGPGSMNFRPGFEALSQMGYGGHVVIECRTLSGEPDKVLPHSASYVRNLMEEVSVVS